MAGMGIAFISARTIALELMVGRLAILRVAGTPVLRQWHLVRRAEKRQLPLAEAFREFLLTEGAGLMDEEATPLPPAAKPPLLRRKVIRDSERRERK